MKKRQLIITKQDDSYSVNFFAMASPCEVIIDSLDEQLANKIGQLVATEVWRIEDKYSRYDESSCLSQINSNEGIACIIDNETFLLLNFADQCYQLSNGLFDITTGVLRQVWRFDCSDNIPSMHQVNNMMSFVGWEKVTYDQEQIHLPKGMEIDFGGIGKEYAVDRVILLLKQLTNIPVLVNLGGDLCASKIRSNKQPWQVGIENPNTNSNQTMVISLSQGALATSGDAKRFLLKNDTRYSHILNAKTGWPIDDAPHSMTVTAPQCIQAGILATLALLQGKNAEQFLEQQDVKYWAVR